MVVVLGEMLSVLMVLPAAQVLSTIHLVLLTLLPLVAVAELVVLAEQDPVHLGMFLMPVAAVVLLLSQAVAVLVDTQEQVEHNLLQEPVAQVAVVAVVADHWAVAAVAVLDYLVKVLAEQPVVAATVEVVVDLVVLMDPLHLLLQAQMVVLMEEEEVLDILTVVLCLLAPAVL